MRIAGLVGLCLVIATPAAAEHGDPFMIVAPLPGTKIPTNAHIRIESYNGIAGGLEEIATNQKGYSAVLVASDHEIELKPVSFFDDHEGGYGAGLLVLAPTKALHARTTYNLEIRWPGGTPEQFASPWSWTTSKKADKKAPKWKGTPTVGSTPSTLIANPGAETPLVEIVADLEAVNGGTAKQIPFVFDLARACGGGPTANYTEAIARTTCPDLGPEGLCQQAYMHDAGADLGKQFMVKLTAVDLAGNRTVAPGANPTITWADDNALTVCIPVATK
jgi:hypothetical protein